MEVEGGDTMALDVYVGSLTRYYTGDWETLGQSIAREQGLNYVVIRPETRSWRERLAGFANRLMGRSGAPTAEQTQAAVVAWRAQLARELGETPGAPLDWDESADAPWFTDRPAWDGYGSLLLLAAHDEHPELGPPTQAPEKWPEDVAWQAATADGGKGSRYRHILTPELWLPCAFEYLFEAATLGGPPAVIGSSVALREQLYALNGKTFQGSAEDLAAWRRDAPEQGGPFDASARYGLALFTEMAEKSVTHRLPMKLDY
jgi:hypothetical protein